jgi:hypothetical protein
MSQVTLQGNASGTGVFTVAAPNSNTNRTLTLPDATGTVVTTDATQTLTNKSISGAQINSGTVAVARLGSGTPGTGNFLRGDGSWQTVPASAPSTTDVLNATAGASVGAVGTYAWLGQESIGTVSAGGTLAGSNLRYAGLTSTALFDSGSPTNTGALPIGASASGTPSGTWRCMGRSRSFNWNTGYQSGTQNGHTIWLRIS